MDATKGFPSVSPSQFSLPGSEEGSVCVCVCVRVRETDRERERDRERQRETETHTERERERGREGGPEFRNVSVCGLRLFLIS